VTEPPRKLYDEGVAIWLDDMRRDRLVSGSLNALVPDSRVTGVTTNPTISHNRCLAPAGQAADVRATSANAS
jgi:transaldolase